MGICGGRGKNKSLRGSEYDIENWNRYSSECERERWGKEMKKKGGGRGSDMGVSKREREKREKEYEREVVSGRGRGMV